MNKCFFLDKRYPLTHPQKRIRYIEELYPGAPLNNIGGYVKIEGQINLEIVEEAINGFIERNEAMRLQMTKDKGEIFQYLTDYRRFSIDFFDFSDRENPEIAFDRWIEQEASTPFDIYDNPLYRFALFKVNSKNTGYLLKFHHLIADGWTTSLLIEEVFERYTGNPNNLGTIPSYVNYIYHENDYLQSKRFQRDKDFWGEKYRQLPTLQTSKPTNSIIAKRKGFVLNRERTEKLRLFLEKEQVSFTSFFSTLLIIYLSRTQQTEDIIIGLPVFNRQKKKFRKTAGMFVSHIPFRVTVPKEESVISLLTRITREQKNCYRHQQYPYDLLAQDLKLRQQGYQTLLNIFVNYYNVRHRTEINGMKAEVIEFHSGTQLYSLQLVVQDWLSSDNLQLFIDYNNVDYCEKDIEQLYSSLLCLMDQLLQFNNSTVGNLQLLTKERSELLLLNNSLTKTSYPKDKLIHQLFELQTQKNPKKIAVEHGDKKLTYQQLNEKANQLANFLIVRGVSPGTNVGLMITHSLDLVIAIFGILKAGGTYLPIDPDYPQERITYILKDGRASFLITDIVNSNLAPNDCEVMNIKKMNLKIYSKTKDELLSKPNENAYIIYTSGSTGNPKGVIVGHRSLVNYSCWAGSQYIKNGNDVFALYSSIAFDLTVTSIFTPLLFGCKVKIYSNDKNEYVLFRIIRDNEATIVKLTPSHLSLIKDMKNDNSSIHSFIVGGEDLKVDLARKIYDRFGQRVRLFNEYGPTEATVGCMIHEFLVNKDIGSSVPIGKPAANTRIYILDQSKQLMPLGIKGEIYISGDPVARGYNNNIDLTSEKFLKDPFSPNRYMYKSGDLGLLRHDGILEYHGRIDSQVKIRGNRIELGEIEACLLNYPSIKDCVVVDNNDQDGAKFLSAYLTTTKDFNEYELREFLFSSLIPSMVPTYLIVIDEIPLTPNGKVNKSLLPKPNTKANNCTADSHALQKEEKQFLKVVSEILLVDNISMSDNFYHLGGDSIKAIQIASKLGVIGLQIKVSDMMLSPILGDIMRRTKTTESKKSFNQGPQKGSITTPPIIDWFFSQNFTNPNHYAQSVLLELEADFKQTQLETAINEIIYHHDALRINIDRDTGSIFYNEKHLKSKAKLKAIELSDIDLSEALLKLKKISLELKESFDIERGLLFKTCLFIMPNSRKLLLLTAHHLVVDGVSWRIITDNLAFLLEQIQSKKQPNLPHKTTSFKEWCQVLEDHKKEISNEEIAFWSSITTNQFRYPLEQANDDDNQTRTKRIITNLTEEETHDFLTIANKPYNTNPEELLIVALSLTMKDVRRQNNTIIEIENHGRYELHEEIDLTETVGWFTSMYPVQLDTNEQELHTQIKQVKEKLRGIQKRGIGFGLLRQLSDQIKQYDMQRLIRFNYIGDLSSLSKPGFFRYSSLDTGVDISYANKMSCLIEINTMVVAGKLNIQIGFCPNDYNELTMQQFISDLKSHIQVIIEYCKETKTLDFTPSDFSGADLSQSEIDSLFA